MFLNIPIFDCVIWIMNKVYYDYNSIFCGYSHNLYT